MNPVYKKGDVVQYNKLYMKMFPRKKRNISMIVLSTRPNRHAMGGALYHICEVLQGDTYLDPRGPLHKEWRDGDSSWAIVNEEELAHAINETKRMLADNSMAAFLAGREEMRSAHGQATFVIGRKPQL